MAGTRMTLTWNGEAVVRKVRSAEIAGVNATMGACVTEAKSSHAWQNRTGTLEGAIAVTDFAREEGSGVTGSWGVFDVIYARIQELGGVVVPKVAKALKIPMPDGSFRFVRSVTIPPRPYLRPAADKLYPGLAGRIQAAYDASGGAGA